MTSCWIVVVAPCQKQFQSLTRVHTVVFSECDALQFACMWNAKATIQGDPWHYSFDMVDVHRLLQFVVKDPLDASQIFPDYVGEVLLYCMQIEYGCDLEFILDTIKDEVLNK
jgi:hypothetical protein